MKPKTQQCAWELVGQCADVLLIRFFSKIVVPIECDDLSLLSIYFNFFQSVSSVEKNVGASRQEGHLWHTRS